MLGLQGQIGAACFPPALPQTADSEIQPAQAEIQPVITPGFDQFMLVYLLGRTRGEQAEQNRFRTDSAASYEPPDHLAHAFWG